MTVTRECATVITVINKKQDEKTKSADGYWYARQDGCAVYVELLYKREFPYNRQSLLNAIETVKNTREVYMTEEAFQAQLEHFQEGMKYLS